LTPKEGRLVGILLDQSIRNSDIPEARRTAHAAVDQLGPGDLAAVVYTSVGVQQTLIDIYCEPRSTSRSWVSMWIPTTRLARTVASAGAVSARWR
jgi:hypothetical protein